MGGRARVSERVVNFDDAADRRRCLDGFARLRGQWRITAVRFRPRRSDRANAWYWPCIVGDFHAWLKEQGWDVSKDQAHEMLKHRFLRREAIDPATGEVVGEYTESTTRLDSAQFSEYCEQCRAWLAEFCGIHVPDPDPDHASKP